MKFFNAIDLWRKPERLEDLLLTCIADSHGRTGLEDAPYPQADYVRSVAKAVLQVTARQFVEQGIKGKAIGEAIETERLKIISEIKKKLETE